MARKETIELPQPQEDDKTYVFTEEELKTIEAIKKRYPTARSAVMPVLWMAQEKFGYLPQKAIKLVADTLGLPYAEVYGVATFYTMYLKEYKAPNLVEICTCFTCGECGGRELYKAIKEHYQCDEEGVSQDKQVWFRETECLGACDTAPVALLNNKRIVHRLNVEKLVRYIEEYLKQGKLPPYESVPLIDQKRIHDGG